jgi:hypothetical protein
MGKRLVIGFLGLILLFPIMLRAETLTISISPDDGAGNVLAVSGEFTLLDCGLGGTLCSDSFTVGSTLELHQTPAPGNVFVGWFGAGIACPATGCNGHPMEPGSWFGYA